MFKKQHLALAIAATLAAANAKAFDAESFTVSGYVKNETAALTKDGQFNGQETGPTDTTKYNDSGDLIKSETSVKLFVNGDVGEGSSMHAELLLHNDSKAKGSHFKNSDSYTQSEFLRELYVDTTAGDWDVRLGKQQVVWGTADGAKLMDIINPTDYREMAQNAMAESRIPVWMLNAEKYLDNGANVQIVLSQPKANVFAGLNENIATGKRYSTLSSSSAYGYSANTRTDDNIGHDQGNAFILKGVDSITGKRNGFLNIVPDLGNVAFQFFSDFGLNPNSTSNWGTLYTATGLTVGYFATLDATVADGNGYSTTVIGNAYDAPMLQSMAALDGYAVLGAFANMYDTNLQTIGSGETWGSNDDSVFEYMENATFATFDAFVNANSEYVFNMPKDLDSDLSLRFRNTTANGMNYSVAYSYAYEKNPVIALSWRGTSGQELTQTITASDNNTITLYDGTTRYGGYAAANLDGDLTDATSTAELESRSATLRFTQTLERAQNIGFAFDQTLDTESLGGVVLRGEFLYTKDARQPVVDLGRISIGDLIGGLKMEKMDRFKYVLGADITVLTDMMLSAQFIQERNLDFIDEASSYGSKTRYTADFASMHMTNGFNKAEKNKEFYSLFLSKPFGESGEGRWNNILMLEEGGGRWNRFDVEYSLSNDLIGTIEYNKYWGDDNTQFGQLEAASNIQVGLKYLFE